MGPVAFEQQRKLGDVSGVVEETVAGIRAVKGFGAEPMQLERLRAEADGVYERSMAAARLRAGFLPVLDLLPSLSLVMILWYGGHQVLDGNLLKVLSWYDNEWGYSARTVDLIAKLAKLK